MIKPASPISGESQNGAVLAILDRYLAGLDDGTGPSIEVLMSQHPDEASEIKRFADALKMMSEAIGTPGATPLPARPSEIDSYVLGQIIGVGGMGIVFRARPKSGGEEVALKILRLPDDQRISRFEREIALTKRLHHEHIVPVLDAGTAQGISYFTMPIIDGPSLDSLIRSLRTQSSQTEVIEPIGHPLLDVAREHGVDSRMYRQAVLELAVTAAETIHFAHEQGIIHRDIKPANLIVDRSGKLWITDFGLAGFAEDPPSRLTQTREMIGTLGYMSPEQSVGRPPDRRADIYSLSMTISELLTLERPFDTGANDVVAERRRLPNKVEATLNRAMSVAPANRHATAIEFADDLRRALNNRRLPRRAVLVLGVLAATGVAGWSLGRIGRTNRSDERRSGTNGEMNGQEQVSSSLHPDDMAVPTIDGASRGRNSFSLWFCDIEGTPVSTVKPDELFYLACSCNLGEYNLFASSMDIHAAPGLDFSMAGRQSASPYKFLRFSHQAGQVEGEGSRTTVCVMSHAFDPTKIQTDKPLWILPCKALRRGTHQLELSANRNFGESVLVFGQNDPIPESELVLGSATLQVE